MQASSWSRGRRLLWIVGLTLLYWGVAKVSFSFGTLPGHVSPVWPPAGLALGAVYLLGPWVAPAVFIGEYLANRTGLPMGSVLGMATGNVVEALLGAYLLKRARISTALMRPRDVGMLIVLGAVAPTFTAAVIGNLSLAAGGVFPATDLLRQIRFWWAGDALGVLIVTPLLLTWSATDIPRVRGNTLELVAMIITAGVTTVLGLQSNQPSAFMLYPVVAWAALRFGGRGASMMTLFVAAEAVYRTAEGEGPFAGGGDAVVSLWLLSTFLAVLAAKSMLLAAVVNDRDRTQRELEDANAELEARVAERTNALRVDRFRLEQAQQIAHIGSWEWDAITDTMTSSTEFQRMYGVDAVGRLPIGTYFDQVHPEDSDVVRHRVLEARDSGEVFDFVHRTLLDSGEIRWMRLRGQSDVVRGVVVRVNGIAQDITDAKLAEETIRANEVRTSRIVDAASEAFVSMDSAGRITDWNRQAELTFGWSRDEVLGLPLADIIIPETLRGAHLEGVHHFMQTGRVRVLNTRREVRALHRNGHHFDVELAVWATEGPHGDTSFHAFMHDITERQQQKAQLAAALDEAREASRSKSAFLANMSHEIRTPMNGVLGMIGLLLDTPLNEQQLDYVNTMGTSAEGLLGIIDDILDVSKIEAGKLSIDKGDFALHRLVQDTISPLMPTATEKGVALLATVAPDVPDAVNGDRLRLRQVIGNLLSNAVKFTARGAVELRVSRNNDQLLFEVLDSGVGIPDDAAAHLFEPFVQADASTTRRFGGTGLGLAISRQLVTLMDGDIGAAAREEGGSRFWFTLPLVPATSPVYAAERQRKVAAPAPVNGARVLVVEDNAVNRKVAAGMLERLGYTVELATDGSEAVAMFSPGAYDAILMDCQMPQMDGYDATVAIRQLESNGHTPIIAMTASAMASDRERCLAVGMDEYLSKPINGDLLSTILRDSMQTATTQSQ